MRILSPKQFDGVYSSHVHRTEINLGIVIYPEVVIAIAAIPDAITITIDFFHHRIFEVT
jgi:hypothetical protein